MTATDQQHAPRPTVPTDPPAPDPGTLDPHLLQQLADAHGVGTSFQGWDGLPHAVAEPTLIKVLAALGVQAHTNQHIEAALAGAELAPWRRMLPPAVVIKQGEPAQVPVHVRDGATVRLTVTLEGGAGLREAVQQDAWVQPREVDGVRTGRATFSLPEDLPLGWHTLNAESEDAAATATLVVTPARLATAEPLEERRGWGLA
ncbi:MAG: 4-alpha-glucanotransferase, partial [Actinomycetes bacterium]